MIGKKVGIDVPETKIGIFIEKDIDKNSYMQSFFDSALVYDDTMKGKIYMDLNFVLEDKSIYLNEKQLISKYKFEKVSEFDCINIDDYVNSIVYFFTNYSAKKSSEYSSEEIDEIKQKAIDRIMFGLKYGIKGGTVISMKRGNEPVLLPYTLSSGNMFSLSYKEEWIEKMLEKKNEEFEDITEKEYKPQFKISQEDDTNLDNSLKYLFKKYPKQAEKSYGKLSQYSKLDLENALNMYEISENKKRFALRVFELRNKVFNKEYNEYLKDKLVDAR